MNAMSITALNEIRKQSTPRGSRLHVAQIGTAEFQQSNPLIGNEPGLDVEFPRAFCHSRLANSELVIPVSTLRLSAIHKKAKWIDFVRGKMTWPATRVDEARSVCNASRRRLSQQSGLMREDDASAISTDNPEPVRRRKSASETNKTSAQQKKWGCSFRSRHQLIDIRKIIQS